MSVVITGAAGYIGSLLAKKLTDKGIDVICVDNLTRGDYSYLSKYKSRRLRLLVEDIRYKDRLEHVFKEFSNLEAIIHLAAIPGLDRCRKDPENAILTNVYGTYNVLELARKYDVKKVVFTSSAAVYGTPTKTPITEDHPLNPLNLYGVTKLAAENLLISYHKNYGLKTVILRFGNVYGVGLYTYWETVIPKFVKQALCDEPLTIYGSGQQARDFIHIYDIIQAIELALEADKKASGEIFNVASGKPISINHVADITSEVMREKFGKSIKRVYLPPRKGETFVKDFSLSIKKIKAKLKFKPKFSIKDGIIQLINYYIQTEKLKISGG